MRSRLALLVLLLLAASQGCETVVGSEDLPYNDQIVVNITLQAGAPLNFVQFRHTIALDKPFDTSFLPDVIATIASEGHSYPYVYNPVLRNGYFADGNDTLRPVSGKQYDLTVDWHGKHATSSTIVPFPTPIDTFRIETYGFNFYDGYSITVQAGAHPQPNVTLLVSYAAKAINDTDANLRVWQTQSTNYYQVMNSGPRSVDSLQWIPYTAYLVPDTIDYRYELILYTFDPQFYKFARTFYKGEYDDAFATGGANPEWNVQGDGLGIFIGMAESTKPVIN